MFFFMVGAYQGDWWTGRGWSIRVLPQIVGLSHLVDVVIGVRAYDVAWIEIALSTGAVLLSGITLLRRPHDD